MLKAKITKNGVEELTLSGDLTDITTDVIALVNKVYESLLETHKDIAAKYKEFVTDAINYGVVFATEENEIQDCIKNILSKYSVVTTK